MSHVSHIISSVYWLSSTLNTEAEKVFIMATNLHRGHLGGPVSGFSVREDFALKGQLAVSAAIAGGQDRGSGGGGACCCPLVGRGQGCCWVSCSAQGSPTADRNVVRNVCGVWPGSWLPLQPRLPQFSSLFPGLQSQ